MINQSQQFLNDSGTKIQSYAAGESVADVVNSFQSVVSTKINTL